MGNRVCKIGKPYNLTSTGWKYTFYVRDASGNIMTTYTKTGSEIENNVLKLDEVMIYGSSRIGTREVNTLLSGLTVPTTTFSRSLGLKRYEFSNHLGNVLTTFTDRKKQVQSGSSVTGYETYIASSQDYYPFGMIMNGRNWNTDSYRFGFNEQEKDDEIVNETGTDLNFKYRIYDSRICRFISIDPLTTKYPYWTPYQFAGNMSIQYRELEGLEPNGGPSFYAGLLGGRETRDEIEKYQAKLFLATAKNVKVAAITATMICAPEVGIPWAVADITGAPVLPAPQAYITNANILTSEAENSTEVKSVFKGTIDDGVAFEKEQGGFMKNHPTIDKYEASKDGGVNVESLKTINTNAKTYANSPSKIFKTGEKYLKQLQSYQDRNYAGFNLKSVDIKERILTIGVPNNLTKEANLVLNQLQEKSKKWELL